MKIIEKLTKAVVGVLLALLLIPFESATGATGTWTTKAPMPTARLGVVTGVIAGQLYVATGQNTTEVSAYDPTTNTWASKAPIPTNRAYASAGVVGGKLYVVGGCINSDCRIGRTNILEVYDPATDTWITKTSMPTARAAMATGVIAGKLYVVGGFDYCSGACPNFNTLEVYDPATNSWMTKTPMPTARSHVDGAVINGKFYVAGGTTNGTTLGNLATLEVYDPSTDAWTTKAPMPTPRHTLGTGEVNGILYAISGVVVGDIQVNTVEAYNPLMDTWITVAPIPTARYGPKPQSINGVLYVAGNGPGNTAISTLEAYTPNQPPIANAGADQNIYLGQAALLNGLASSDPDGSPLTYVWTLDAAPAGSTAALAGATTATPSLTPDVAGVYHLSLVVNDGTQNSAASTVAINVSLNLPPIAVATGNPVSGYAPLPVVFDAGASRDPESAALSFSWNFGDPASGANNTSALKNPIHTYAGVGNYSAVVTVTDNLGKTDQASVAITVTAPNLPPVVSPTATPNNGIAPLNVQFAANATDVNSGDVLSYSWNFGDGSPLSTLANPQHSYAAGTYTAVVRVSDGVNAPVSANLTISVGSALTIDVTEAKVERGEKGKVEGKINMQAGFNFAGMPASGDIISVKFDGITLLNVPFGSFRQESAGKYEYATKTQEAEIDFNRKTIKVSSHKILTGEVNNANGIDVVISFGAATGTDNFVMTSQKGEKDNRDSDLSHKKDSKRK